MRRTTPIFECEKLFLREIANKDKDYIYSPRWFRFSTGTKYLPDFYCVQDGTFIEVVDTPEAYNHGKPKYELMKIEYPLVKLVFVWMCDQYLNVDIEGFKIRMKYLRKEYCE